MESKDDDDDDDAFTEESRELIIHEIFISHQNPKTARAQK